ncbi:hypothetical protein FIU86_08905 [Roseovarius sp. THAF9]|uniref:DUF1127 domain-containing protein n=1 Tax=Roseovarius sp. THAF9 TaxID=2587847 RepID=UPI001267B7D6|nr:DUF1127 domain-containing protein [Roseovarius sp. THAF9]QFT92961.1 hypothetical protein FIU86_08905 [Roseovarius sp. THAF9]
MTSFTRTDRTALEGLSARTTLPVLSLIAVKLAWACVLWTQRRKTRGHLSRLDDHMLRDIGLSPREADMEARKPFWRP